MVNMTNILPAASITRRTLGLAAAACVAGTSQSRAALTIGELYGPVTAEGLQLSAAGRALVGRRVTLTGYMAPPLKAESEFFVLTRYPMSTCPFCSNAADWPADIVVVNLSRNAEMLGAAYAIEVSGVLEVGAKIDPGTGFVSLVRVVEAEWRRR
jgi:hypothetical protein